MKILDNILKSLYNGSNTSVYIYIIAAFLASLLIFIIVLMSLKAKKDQKKEKVLSTEPGKTLENINSGVKLNGETKPEIAGPQVSSELAAPVPEIIQTESSIPTEINTTSLVNEEKVVSSEGKEEFSAVYIDKKPDETLIKSEVLPETTPVVPPVIDEKPTEFVSPNPVNEIKKEFEPVTPVAIAEEEISTIKKNETAFQFEPIDAPKPLEVTPGIVVPSPLVFTEEAKVPEVVVPEFEPVTIETAFSEPEEVKAQEISETDEPYKKSDIYTNSPIILTADDVKAKLAKLQEKTKALHETNESLEIILKKVGLEEQANAGSITDEENRLLGR